MKIKFNGVRYFTSTNSECPIQKILVSEAENIFHELFEIASEISAINDSNG
jgi:hypothetical protein